MTDLSFPADYGSRPGRRVLINDSLVPYIAGAMAWLERSDSWATESDYSAAYAAIAALYIAMSELEVAEENTILAGPADGGPAPATFRNLVADDIPYIPADKLTSGLVPLALGGTGADLSATGSAYAVLQQKAPGDSIHVAPLVAPHIPNLSTDKLTSGVLPVARGGTGASTAPAFRAWLAAPQVFAGSTFTKLLATTEQKDTTNAYDAANARFTPTVPGTYLFTAYAVFLTPNQDQKGAGLYIYKNGVRSQIVENFMTMSGTGDFGVQMIGQLDADSDDYFELYGYHTMTINCTVWQGSGTFSATRIGP